MERTSMTHSIYPYFGRWDIGGGLIVEKRDDGFYLKPRGRFEFRLVFFYTLVLVGLPFVGALTLPGLYAAAEAVRNSGDVLAVFRNDLTFTALAIGYVAFLLLYPIWALFFRGKPMVLFSLRDYTVVFGRFWHYRLRSAVRRIPFENIREIEILKCGIMLRDSEAQSQGREPARKIRYWLSVITDSEEPHYITMLPASVEMRAVMQPISEECRLPLVLESFPKHI